MDGRSGYGYVPVRVESRHEPNGVLSTLEWTTAGRREGRGELTIVGGSRAIRFTCGDLELVHQVPKDVLLIPPAIAAEAQVLLGLALDVGEVRTLQVAHLRPSGRRPVSSPWSVRRLPVAEVTPRDPRAADRFVLERENERIELVLDAREAPLRRTETRGGLEVGAVRD